MARRKMNDLLSDEATQGATEMLEASMPPGSAPNSPATTDSISDLDLAALAEGPAAPVGADMGGDAPESQLLAAAEDPGVSPQETDLLRAQLMEAARRRMLAQGGAGGAGGGGLAGV